MTRCAPTPPLELEIKFRLPPEANARLAAHPALHGASHTAHHDITTYYDTPDGALARDGISLRVRRRGDRRTQTLKLPGTQHGGAFARQEWEWPIGSDNPEPQCLRETPLAARLDQLDDLQPVFVTDVRRSVQTVQRDGASIEVSLDRGRVRAGKAVEPIHELELELKDGTPQPLYQLAAALHAAMPLILGAESKAARGWRLRSGHPHGAVKQAPIVLPDGIAAAGAFQRIIHAVLAHLLSNVPAAEAGDAEGVHQLRAAIRRLRAALVLFRPHLEPHALARFTDELRRIGQVFGEARDWDVFCTETLPMAGQQGVDAGWLELLRDPAERMRAAAHGGVAAELQGTGFTAVVLGLAAWAGEAPRGDGNAHAMREPLSGLDTALLGRLADKVQHRGRHLAQRPDDALHALRKSLKKLRYGLEFVAPQPHSKPLDEYLHGCRKLLKQLGALNDARVAIALAERLGGERRAELAPAVAALAGWAADRRHQARHRLRKEWRAFSPLRLPIR